MQSPATEAAKQAQRDRDAFELARSYLLQLEGVTPAILDMHLTCDPEHPATLNEIYKELLKAAQTPNMMPTVISRAIGGLDRLGPFLGGFDPQLVAQKYQDWPGLLDDIVEQLQPRGKVRRTQRSIWPRFCRTVISGARFLTQFQDARDFLQWVDYFDQDDRVRPALPMMLAREVEGVGFPVACDFLMGLGYPNFGKPDVHLKTIFVGLGLSATDDDYDVFKAMLRVARHAGVTPYAVDKAFWLIGSGNFDQAGLQVGGNREAFMAYALERLE
ncbi:MAG: hypothetical protein JXA37_03820 [Chloroflexia bacterium]|nr:hypothetical protein [Chloroflexia bacterium]